jgi:HrpA-like RNA helicase
MMTNSYLSNTRSAACGQSYRLFSFYTDLLLGMVKKCINNRGDLRVVVTSATIDPAVFVDYFGGSCPILSVSGRMFPVDVIWPEGPDTDNIGQLPPK